LVLGARFQSAGHPPVIIIQRDSDKTPVLVEFQYFDVIDPAISGDWCLFDFGGGQYGLEPKEFAGDFWGRFHDGDPEAERTFKLVVEQLERFHG